MEVIQGNFFFFFFNFMNVYFKKIFNKGMVILKYYVKKLILGQKKRLCGIYLVFFILCKLFVLCNKNDFFFIGMIVKESFLFMKVSLWIYLEIVYYVYN